MSPRPKVPLCRYAGERAHRMDSRYDVAARISAPAFLRPVRGDRQPRPAHQVLAGLLSARSGISARREGDPRWVGRQGGLVPAVWITCPPVRSRRRDQLLLTVKVPVMPFWACPGTGQT